MAHYVSGTLSEEGRVIVLNESDVTESNTVIAGGGGYEVAVSDATNKTVVCQTDAGEFLGYGKVTPWFREEFVFTVEPTSPFELPLTVGGTYNFTVDWGDGTDTDTITEWDDSVKNHNYAGSGPYEIKITGTIEGWSFNDNSYAPAMREVKEWGPVRLGNAGAYFDGCTNLTISATDVLDLTGTTDMTLAFKDCRVITNIPSLNNWDMSEVTNMTSMFEGCLDLNGIQVNNWDTSKVTSMQRMFWLNVGGSFGGIFNIDVSDWDVSSVTDMSEMFRYCTSFDCDLSGWVVSEVTDMNYIFGNCYAFNGDTSGWDVAKVENMEGMFSSAQSFNQDISGWDVSVTTIKYMFMGATLFNQDIGGWNISGLDTDGLEGTFNSAEAFDQDLNSWNIDSVTSLASTFARTFAFNTTLSGWDTTGVTDMYHTFERSVFNQDLSMWDTSSVTTMEGMFDRNDAFNQDISGWDVSSVETMREMFRYCDNFNTTLSGWATSSVEDMYGMFQDASSFDQDLGHLDITSVSSAGGGERSMYYMLNDCGMSVENYSTTLVGWEAQSVNGYIHLGALGIFYDGSAIVARAALVADHDWVIDDGGESGHWEEKTDTGFWESGAPGQTWDGSKWTSGFEATIALWSIGGWTTGYYPTKIRVEFTGTNLTFVLTDTNTDEIVSETSIVSGQEMDITWGSWDIYRLFLEQSASGQSITKVEFYEAAEIE